MSNFFISDALAETDTITVQDTDAVPEAPAPIESSGWHTLVPMVLIFVVFYFFLIRPQEKRRKRQEELVTGVKVGEEVLTSAGFFGIIRKLDDSENIAYIEIAKDIEIKVLKTSISDITSRAKPEKAAKQINSPKAQKAIEKKAVKNNKKS